MPVSADAFRQALSRFASGVTVVTARHGERQAGLTVSAFCSVSLQPPLILVCIDHRSSAIPLIRASRVFGVNILAANQAGVSAQFASHAGNRFAGIAHAPGPLGAPLLLDALARLECALVQEVEAGDHLVFIGQVESSDVHPDAEPLLYYRGAYAGLARTTSP